MVCKPTLESLEDRTLLSAGALDPTFGMGGEIETYFGNHDQTARLITEAGAVRLFNQAGGKIVAVGFSVSGGAVYASEPPGVAGSGSFALARYNADGTLDPSFGLGGKVTSPLGRATDATLQANGDILVAGTNQFDFFALARYTPDGTLDTTFGSGGSVTTSAYRPYQASLAVQPDGKILLAVSRFSFSTAYSTIDLFRYSSDGTLDTTFGSAGEVTEAGKGTVLIQRDGKIIVASTFVPTDNIGNSTAFVTRFNSDGSLDHGFPQRLNLGVGPFNSVQGAVLQADDKIVILASSTHAGFLVRLNADGTPDTGFGVNGQASSGGNALALQRDGSIVVPHQWIAGEFLASPESDQGEVKELYHRFLHRPPEAAALTVFGNQLQTGVANEQVMALLLGSNEYFQLAQQ